VKYVLRLPLLLAALLTVELVVWAYFVAPFYPQLVDGAFEAVAEFWNWVAIKPPELVEDY
jgi:hypothetical protein